MSSRFFSMLEDSCSSSCEFEASSSDPFQFEDENSGDDRSATINFIRANRPVTFCKTNLQRLPGKEKKTALYIVDLHELSDAFNAISIKQPEVMVASILGNIEQHIRQHGLSAEAVFFQDTNKSDDDKEETSSSKTVILSWLKDGIVIPGGERKEFPLLLDFYNCRKNSIKDIDFLKNCKKADINAIYLAGVYGDACVYDRACRLRENLLIADFVGTTHPNLALDPFYPKFSEVIIKSQLCFLCQDVADGDENSPIAIAPFGFFAIFDKIDELDDDCQYDTFEPQANQDKIREVLSTVAENVTVTFDNHSDGKVLEREAIEMQDVWISDSEDSEYTVDNTSETIFCASPS